MAHQGYDNARQRRNDKRKALTAAYNATHGIEEKEFCVIDRPTLSLNRKAVSRVDKALSVQTTKHYPSADNICLADVAIFNAGYRKSAETVTAR
jgi:hypothetical protein